MILALGLENRTNMSPVMMAVNVRPKMISAAAQ
jgi:hypothetical protein